MVHCSKSLLVDINVVRVEMSLDGAMYELPIVIYIFFESNENTPNRDMRTPTPSIDRTYLESICNPLTRIWGITAIE